MPHIFSNVRMYSPVSAYIHQQAHIFTNKCVLIDVFNTLKPRQNGRHFVDDTFKHISLSENVRISIAIISVVPNVFY